MVASYMVAIMVQIESLSCFVHPSFTLAVDYMSISHGFDISAHALHVK